MKVEEHEYLLAQMDSMQSQYGDKFLKEIHPLIKKYHKTTGNDFHFSLEGKVTIQYNSGHYWVVDGDIFKNHQSGLWFDEEGCDIYGKKFGGKHDKDGWFNLVCRLCCKYKDEIISKIEFDLQELMK